VLRAEEKSAAHLTIAAGSVRTSAFRHAVELAKLKRPDNFADIKNREDMMKQSVRGIAACCALLAAAVFATGSARAQDYPGKPVTIVVPFGPGGSSDTYGRYLADALAKRWNQSVVVENRAGAGSSIGTAHVAKSKPDGYTLLFVSASFATSPATMANLPYDPVKDLTPVAMVGISDLFVMTGTRVPLASLADVAKQAGAQTLFAGTPGVGSLGHLAQLLLADTLGVKFQYVHQTSGAAVLTDVRGRRVDTAVGIQFEAKSGNARPIAVMGDERNAEFPDVPTVVELGFPAAQATNWVGAFAPSGTPKEVIAKINREIVAVLQAPEAASFLEAQALRTSDDSPEEFAAFVATELDRWKAVAEKAGLRK
jgi:tripartite-type tricarboxylate transporter receptor subunit TctC